MAQAAILNCPQNPPPAPESNGLSYLILPAVEGPFAKAERALLVWNNRGNSWPSDNTVYNGDPELLSFANMIRTTTTAVGCSDIECGKRAAVACFFSHPNVQPGTSVYTHENLVAAPSTTTASPSSQQY
ncbi:hypothetical protein KIN20_019411 [Parelaphostrongylus tenuis]|uniref:SCP domain-containing protein n=1 Tax=Parelaphostrongylus tenuis TaxID=148309 RepID=A0AAD5N342_PARTN|nr:hypothetical protein KIN20_019411 [Parelaphostrongylus tenuis]